jgi:hypothetical protein
MIGLKQLAHEFKIEPAALRAILRIRFSKSHPFGRKWVWTEKEVTVVRKWLAKVVEDRDA